MTTLLPSEPDDRDSSFYNAELITLPLEDQFLLRSFQVQIEGANRKQAIELAIGAYQTFLLQKAMFVDALKQGTPSSSLAEELAIERQRSANLSRQVEELQYQLREGSHELRRRYELRPDKSTDGAIECEQEWS